MFFRVLVTMVYLLLYLLIVVALVVVSAWILAAEECWFARTKEGFLLGCRSMGDWWDNGSFIGMRGAGDRYYLRTPA